MSGKRVSVFDDEDALDVSGFVPKPIDRAGVRPEQVRAVSESAQFQSREPALQTPSGHPTRAPRRYRTGRNIQLNIKARTEAITTFYAIADQQGWVLGETFEHAIAALQRELGTKR
jgi:hypothetical protein